MAKKAKPVRYDEIEGKVVAGAGFNFSTMLIVFTDGTVLAISADGGCDGEEINFAQGSDIDLLSNRWASNACEAGVITREELRQSIAAQNARRIERLESELKSLNDQSYSPVMKGREKQ
jgi:hypothetical protein